MLQEHGKGRVYIPDHRDTRHQMLRLLSRETIALKSKFWQVGPARNQGGSSSCVGHGWWHRLTAVPNRIVRPDVTPYTIYNLAQRNDEWAGEDYLGTSVRGGAIACQKLGLIGEYLWSWDVMEIAAWVCWKGPVVIGVDWFEGMEDTDEEGYIKPTGRPLGGHCVAIVGYSMKRRALRILNSWSREWGERGRAWMTLDHSDYLIHKLNGEACTAPELAA